jgi:hypothetical protein
MRRVNLTGVAQNTPESFHAQAVIPVKDSEKSKTEKE